MALKRISFEAFVDLGIPVRSAKYQERQTCHVWVDHRCIRRHKRLSLHRFLICGFGDVHGKKF